MAFLKEVQEGGRDYAEGILGVVCEYRRRKNVAAKTAMVVDVGMMENSEKVQVADVVDESQEFTMDRLGCWGGPCAPCPIYATEICAEAST